MKVKTTNVRPLTGHKRFVAGDLSILREILHPDKGREAISYSLAHAMVKPGVTTLKHRLKASEVYYILSGRGRMYINGQTMPVKPGDTVYIPPRAIQCITNTGRKDLLFICLVSPPWRARDEEIFQSPFV